MRRLSVFLLIFVVITCSVPLAAAAQEPVEIEQMTVAIWPEFDRAEVLVIYRITIGAANFPATVRVPIPASVGDPFAVAYVDSSGGLVVAPYELVPAADWTEIVLEAGSAMVQVEYYAPYSVQEDERTFSFSWPAGYAIGELAYEIQEPLGASSLRMSPPIQETIQREDLLKYHIANLGALSEGQSFEWHLTYSKADDGLTVDQMQASASPAPEADPILMPEGGTPDFTRYIPWILGGAGGVLLIAAGVLYMRSVRSTLSRKVKPRRRSSASEVKDDAMKPSPVFCHQCGTRGEASDRFCRHCGTRLRT